MQGTQVEPDAAGQGGEGVGLLGAEVGTPVEVWSKGQKQWYADGEVAPRPEAFKEGLAVRYNDGERHKFLSPADVAANVRLSPGRGGEWVGLLGAEVGTPVEVWSNGQKQWYADGEVAPRPQAFKEGLAVRYNDGTKHKLIIPAEVAANVRPSPRAAAPASEAAGAKRDSSGAGQAPPAPPAGAKRLHVRHAIAEPNRKAYSDKVMVMDSQLQQLKEDCSEMKDRLALESRRDEQWANALEQSLARITETLANKRAG